MKEPEDILMHYAFAFLGRNLEAARIALDLAYCAGWIVSAKLNSTSGSGSAPAPDVEEIKKGIAGLQAQGVSEMAKLKDIQDQNTALVQAVQAEDTAVDGAIVLMNGLTGQISSLSQQLADAIAASDSTAIQAVADSLAATTKDLTDKTTALATAVTANTPTPPASPTVPVAPTVPTV